MAARLPEGNEQSRPQFLNQSPWDWQPLWPQMAARGERAFPHAVAWTIDDTGFPKKGEHSVGVARQCSGTLGKRRPTVRLPSACTAPTHAAARR
jgi:SRSO17 transposase